MLISLLILAGGFVLLIGGAELLVRGASSLARRFRVPEIVIVLTVVALGTSTPELILNI
ncbi:MAG: sodium:calcium antiporter, partial [Candidatus Syntrophosphaera sp.]|nr:sodium:calcium antiporter [Candidatus Syntrophosphaera sp.]